MNLQGTKWGARKKGGKVKRVGWGRKKDKRWNMRGMLN